MTASNQTRISTILKDVIYGKRAQGSELIWTDDKLELF